MSIVGVISKPVAHGLEMANCSETLVHNNSYTFLSIVTARLETIPNVQAGYQISIIPLYLDILRETHV